jgi:hypothetical protein
MHLVCPATRSAAARMAQLSIVDALFGRCADNPAAAETNLRCTISAVRAQRAPWWATGRPRAACAPPQCSTNLETLLASLSKWVPAQ